MMIIIIIIKKIFNEKRFFKKDINFILILNDICINKFIIIINMFLFIK
jgi:hypothetical protein